MTDGQTIVLSWTTESETNNAGFDVEMQYGAKPFAKVAFVAGAGTTDLAQTYEYVFHAPTSGDYVLRLKQIDFDGTFAYSDEVAASIELEAAYAWEPTHPNPFNPTAQFGLEVATTQDVTIQVVDMTGRIVATLHNGRLAAATRHRFLLEGDHLPSGTYWIRALGETFQSSQPAVLLK